MHVRIRDRGNRLFVSLVETRRLDGKVRNEHIASFGSVPVPPSIDDRIAFWQRLHERLAKLANRVDAATKGRVLGAVHARIPMPIVDEQTDVRLRNAEAEERFWQGLHDMSTETVAGHRRLIATAERAIKDAQARADEAAEKAAAARDRAERIRRGEDVQGGFGKPLDGADLERSLREAGMSTSDIRYLRGLGELKGFVGEAGWRDLNLEIVEATERAHRAVVRRLLAAYRAESETAPDDDEESTTSSHFQTEE